MSCNLSIQAGEDAAADLMFLEFKGKVPEEPAAHGNAIHNKDRSYVKMSAQTRRRLKERARFSVPIQMYTRELNSPDFVSLSLALLTLSLCIDHN